MVRVKVLSAVAGALLFFEACSSTPKNTFTLTEFYTAPIRIRRPTYAPSNPTAGPGGIDYQASPAPSKNFDCQDSSALFRNLQKPQLLACLMKIQTEGSVDEPKIVKYDLELGVQPVLKLDEDLEKPTCLRTTLPEIAVPREIFFQSDLKTGEGERLTCFSSRLEIEKGETLGIRLSSSGGVLKLTFPIDPFPKSIPDLDRLLTAWALTPLFKPAKEPFVEAKIVPDSLCKKCFDRKDVLQRRPKDPPKWPRDVAPTPVETPKEDP